MIDDFPELRAEKLAKKYPQFASAGSLLIEAINHALPQIDAAKYAELADLAVELLAADWLMNHEFGQSLRGGDSGSYTYFKDEFDKIKIMTLPKMFVI